MTVEAAKPNDGAGFRRMDHQLQVGSGTTPDGKQMPQGTFPPGQETTPMPKQDGKRKPVTGGPGGRTL